MHFFSALFRWGWRPLINGFLVLGFARWGRSAIDVAHALWWLDAAMAFACAWVVPYLMFTRQDHSLQNMTAVWLLPIVAAEVTAASGGLLLGHLPTGTESLRVSIWDGGRFTFPIGVYALATLTLGRITGVSLFVIMGAFFVVLLTCFWLIVTGRTLHGAYHAHLFVAPCLSDGTGLQRSVLTDKTMDEGGPA